MKIAVLIQKGRHRPFKRMMMMMINSRLLTSFCRKVNGSSRTNENHIAQVVCFQKQKLSNVEIEGRRYFL